MLFPPEKELPTTSSVFSVVRPAHPTTAIFQNAGNVKILSWPPVKNVGDDVRSL
jgi:hypothetical protein